MPVFQLSEELIFPHPSLAEDGLLAVGGDLSPERLLLAYENGIFPWYNEGEPILWHAPDPRFVLFPKKIKVSKSMKQILKKANYEIGINTAFKKVLYHCKTVEREDQDGTWITSDIENAYLKLHELGYAHSVEIFNLESKLVGGLYGIKLGSVFFGESMFQLESNASKIALIHLATNFKLSLIDCQVHTDHLESMGAEEITLDSFLELLKAHL